MRTLPVVASVWFPPGTYLSGPLTGYRDVSLIGAGRDISIIKASSGGNLLSYALAWISCARMSIYGQD